jgi:hypothetical protein
MNISLYFYICYEYTDFVIYCIDQSKRSHPDSKTRDITLHPDYFRTISHENTMYEGWKRVIPVNFVSDVQSVDFYTHLCMISCVMQQVVTDLRTPHKFYNILESIDVYDDVVVINSTGRWLLVLV